MYIDRYVIRNILKILVEYAAVILLGLTIVYLDESEFTAINIHFLIVGLAGIKSIYFFIKGFRKISELSGLDLQYYEFLVFIAVNIGVIIVSFGFDYFCLYRVDPKSFSGIPNEITPFLLSFKFFYFSLMIFTNIGIIKIVPESTSAEVLVILEAILSFITIIFVLSDFLSLKESLGKRRKILAETDVQEID
ncbi:ion transporter [Leptospira kmetyi]|uniref:Ion transporter n=2 Tax=Leptospira kmetyi TaxID=408139 RepID=A0ABX4NGZ1_9LEPT|nr:ion transporter [Leptospira kmetyi]PJZ30785.1 ion transporter [Leptospira kmetyi]PJZ40473.1 ion transporter [Leptospira kmetyi]TGK27402.1 ion transporter [Leptospira kmetyi]TGL64824.1 ion transporter [Leptospira kmetyi]